MKRLLIILAAGAILANISLFELRAAETNNASKQVRALITKVDAKIQQGKEAESDFADELKEFDKLIGEFKDKEPEAASEAAFMKALLYVQVLSDSEKGAKMMRAVTNDYPKTKLADQARQVLASVDRQAAAKKIQESLKVGSKFPDISETDVNGKPFNLKAMKGKVVLVDFWATWCPPCRAELPNVIEAYKKYHDKGFEILAISLDKEKEKLLDYVKEHEMPWQQYFDGKGWENKLTQQFGITGIPATFLLDGEGKIIAKDLRGEDLSDALGKALAKK